MKLVTLFLGSVLSVATPFLAAAEYQLYLLAGQSNMEGFGYVSELPDAYRDFGDEVLIFHGNDTEDDKAALGLGIWAPLRPGHGRGFSSDGKANHYSDRFGPELGFAKALRARDPNAKIAIVKYARSGTALDRAGLRNSGRWNFDYGNGVGTNQYDHCIATLRSALAVSDIDGDGEVDTLVPAGILWMQGESDGNEIGPAMRYEDNLRVIVGLFRAALRDLDLPVAIGRISDSGREEDGFVWDFGNVVRNRQEAFCASDAMATLVTTTDEYSYSDKWHYDSAGFIDLGEQFAKALRELKAGD